MKKLHINNKRTVFFALCIIVATYLLTVTAMAMGLPGNSRMGGREGMENNIPENGIVNDAPSDDGNLGDTDGDGVIEDNGNGGGVMSDIGEMGSEIISDVGDMGSEIISDIGDNTDSAKDTGTAPIGTDSGTAAEDEGGSSLIGIIVAVVIAIAVILIIIALIPKNKDKH